MRYRFRIVVSVLLCYLSAGASFAATRDEIRSAVESRYRYTVPGFLGDFKAIGSVMVVQKEGLKAHRPTAIFKANVVENGRLVVPGGGNLPLGGGIDGALKGGDRIYLYSMRSGDDYVELELFTVKPFVVTGAKGAIPLQASTRFRYEGGLAGVRVSRVMDDIASWFRTEEEIRYAPAGTVTATIRHGQTEDEVVAIFGQPEKRVLLGAKTVYLYRNLKVIFVDGKVADAE
jgi:hypothetical protein